MWQKMQLFGSGGLVWAFFWRDMRDGKQHLIWEMMALGSWCNLDTTQQGQAVVIDMCGQQDPFLRSASFSVPWEGSK